ncbi:hypothetical protein MLR40_027495 [Escherichia coli]|nr:hypothetical protein [Escherichia coli]MCN4780630.1 hypothetical protein [Escherichia coli]MCN5476989.1 hypothetical protein [Escherichia coli]MCN5825304.1 hypothetical protein [Escherichia coli]MCN7230311.1 hypothetical protein [Escherichia coli]MCN8040329.1 hypothetical protein [Escherichia coli]
MIVVLLVISYPAY